MNKSEDLSGVYKIVIVDDSHIGKSQFLNMFIKKKHLIKILVLQLKLILE